MNIPNVLTAIRFVLIPVFIFTFTTKTNHYILISMLIFLIAGITDFLDGYIARKYNIVTKWGQAMDPLADKLMQLTFLICFTIEKYLPLWIILLVGAKEILMVLGALILYYQKDKLIIPANKYGKFATVVFYIAAVSVAFQLPYSTLLMAAAVIVTLVALLQYAVSFRKEHNKNFTG